MILELNSRSTYQIPTLISNSILILPPFDEIFFSSQNFQMLMIDSSEIRESHHSVVCHICKYSPAALVAWDDRIAAAKSSLQGELRWEFCAPIMVTGDGLLLLRPLQLPMMLPCAPPCDAAPPTELPAMVAPPPPAPDELGPLSPLFPDPFVWPCGKYPPGEGRPSGPSPGLRLRTNAGGLQRCKWNRESLFLKNGQKWLKSVSFFPLSSQHEF